MAWDDVAGRAAGGHGDKYVVLQPINVKDLLYMVPSHIAKI